MDPIIAPRTRVCRASGAEQLGADAVAEAAETTYVAIGDGCGQLDLDGDHALVAAHHDEIHFELSAPGPQVVHVGSSAIIENKPCR